jgi:ABC-2 type transport system ATP-binding protein
MSAFIEIEGLTQTFRPVRPWRQFVRGIAGDEVHALKDVSFNVSEGEVFGLVGQNGAGKTTLIKVLSTLLIPTAGRVHIAGHDVEQGAAAIRRRIGLVSSNERSFYWRLTARQNLRFFARLYNVDADGREAWIERLLDSLSLLSVADRRFDAYSTGMRQRLAFARALLNKPSIVFMDEPTKGLDPMAAQSMVELVRSGLVHEWRPTIIITSHQLSELERLCQRFLILSSGTVLRCGTMDELHQSVTLRSRCRIVAEGVPPAVLESLREAVRTLVVTTIEHPSVQIDFDQRDDELGFVLAQLTAAGARVRRCLEQPVTLEDVFSLVVAREGKS